jgi:cytochrome c oxidase accessory protein FixG
MTAPAPILSSMKQDGSRLMVHPADVRGRWTRVRRGVFAALIAFYLAAPFIPVGGHPMIQIDVQHRSFFLFGQTFNSQDVWMVLLLILSFAFAMLLVTAWRGRLWCGFACPQSVFLEGVYRPVERFFEGPRERRLKAYGEPWTAGRVARRAAKLATYLVISTAIAHTATAIFVSPHELKLMILEGPSAHPEAFMLTSGFTAILMFNFTWFREQFCVVLCPYGRLQSVLQDKQSVVVTYDEKRGEPRGRVLKGADGEVAKAGDCVDCKKCIHVCPTGIDIRNGMQMECLACNQCVDACDEVMVKLKRPEGLIRFMSQAELNAGKRQVLRPRLLVYAALFALSAGTLGISLAFRSPFEANVFRNRGANPFVIDGTVVRNAFEVHVFNKNPQPGRFHLELKSPVEAKVIIGTPDLELNSLTDAHVPVMVSIERAQLKGPVDLQLQVKDETTGADKVLTVRFLAPPAM